jgi:hypothetical protein
VPINVAEQVWTAQADVHLTAANLKGTFGEWAIGWFARATMVAGSSGNVTTGTLTEQQDGSLRYSPGGTTLRIIRKSGYTFDLRADALVGNVRATNFPADGERLNATFLWASGLSLRCDVQSKHLLFDGTFLEDDGTKTTVRVSQTRTSQLWSGTNEWGTGYSVEVFGDSDNRGRVEHGGQVVEYISSLLYSTCSGVCGSNASSDYLWSHDVVVSLEGRIWRLKYHTGYKQQSSSSPKVNVWDGQVFEGTTQVGGLVKRPISQAGYALEVNVRGDSFLVRGVSE